MPSSPTASQGPRGALTATATASQIASRVAFIACMDRLTSPLGGGLSRVPFIACMGSLAGRRTVAASSLAAGRCPGGGPQIAVAARRRPDCIA